MSLFTKCVTALLGEMLYMDNKARITPIAITDDDSASYISDKADLPTNFTKLGKHIMISGGSWVFNKKERGNNDVYGHFRLKLQIPTKKIINRVSFEFSCLGGKNLHLKQHQAMETKTPVMLLFVCNGTETESIISDTRQMLDSAYEDIDKNEMMPEEFENNDIPHFTLHVNVPPLPSETKSNSNKGYNHYKEHGKKAFHFIPFFEFLASHAHRLQFKNKHFGKFAKFTAILGNNAPMSDCIRLRRCIQGHLNFPLSSTSITINGIDNLDASEILRNPANMKPIRKLSLRDVLYQIKLESKAPIFLQLSQCSTGGGNAGIPNTPKAELMAKRMNVQIAAWYFFYWKETNPGANRFY